MFVSLVLLLLLLTTVWAVLIKGGKFALLAIPLSIILWIYFFVPLFIQIVGSHVSNPFFASTYQTFTSANLYAAVYTALLILGFSFPYIRSLKRISASTKVVFHLNDRRSITVLWFVWLCVMIIAVARYGNRFGEAMRIYERGGGGWFFIGYMGFLLPLFFAVRPNGRRSFKEYSVLILLSIPAGLFFFSSGQRGGAMYPLVLGTILYFGFPKGIGKRLLAVFCAPVLLVIANSVTAAIRNAFISAELSELPGFFTGHIPLAFSHGEVLAAVVDNSIYLPFEILWNSLINWVPSAWLEKGLTAGPEIAIIFLPDVFRGWHTTSLTTGPLVESALYFGPFGVLIGAIHGIALSIIGLYRSSPELKAALIWLFGFQVFFDDLGGVVTKLMLLISAYTLLILLLRGRFSTQMTRRYVGYTP